MTDSTMRPSPISWDPRRLPSAYLWGLGLGLLGLVVSFNLTRTSSFNGATTCGSTDLAAFVFAAVCGLTAVDGARKQRSRRVQDRMATRWMAVVFTGALALLTVVHILRGMGHVGGPC